MYPEAIPDSILRLADFTRPDHVDANKLKELLDRVQQSAVFVGDWIADERFWELMSRTEFPTTLSQILPHTTNGDFGLATLVQSRADIPTDPAFSARKALAQVPILLAESEALGKGATMESASVLVQVLDDLFAIASGGLLMSTNLISQGYSVPVHAGIIEVGTKTISSAVRRLKQHLGVKTSPSVWP